MEDSDGKSIEHECDIETKVESERRISLETKLIENEDLDYKDSESLLEDTSNISSSSRISEEYVLLRNPKMNRRSSSTPSRPRHSTHSSLIAVGGETFIDVTPPKEVKSAVDLQALLRTQHNLFIKRSPSYSKSLSGLALCLLRSKKIGTKDRQRQIFQLDDVFYPTTAVGPTSWFLNALSLFRVHSCKISGYLKTGWGPPVMLFFVIVLFVGLYKRCIKKTRNILKIFY